MHRAAAAGNLRQLRRQLAALPAASRQRNLIVLAAAESAANNGHLDVVAYLLQSVDDPSSRNSWCFNQLSTKAELLRHPGVVICLVRTISDQRSKDRCCARVIEQVQVHVSEQTDWSLVNFLVQTISDVTLKEIVYSKIVLSAAELNAMTEVREFSTAISDESLRDRSQVQATKAAARAGKIEAVEFLLPQIINKDLRDSGCIEAAEAAASGGHMEVCKFIVRTISDAHRDRCCILTAKHAAKHGDIGSLEFLTAIENFALEDSRDECCLMALQYAAMYGQLESTTLLVERRLSECVRDEGCASAVCFASIYNHLAVVKYLMPQISDPDLKERCCKTSVEPSIRKGHFAVAEFLIGSISDEATKHQYCRTYVDCAVNEGFDQVQVKNSLFTIFSLDKTAADFHEKCAEITSLVQGAAYQNLDSDEDLKAAAELAAKRENFCNAISKINKITKPVTRDQCCSRVIDLAAKFYQWETVKSLVKAMQNEFLRSQCSMKAVESASQSGNIDTVRFLLQHVATEDLTPECLKKSIQTAAIHGHYEVVEFLVGKITCQELKDESCRNAAMHAAAWNRLALFDFLVKQISSEVLKNECCFDAAMEAEAMEAESRSRIYLEAEILCLRAVTDGIRRDEYCAKRYETADEMKLNDAVRFVELIEDKDKRDQLSIKLANTAIYRGKWKVATKLLQVASEPYKIIICRRIAESAVNEGSQIFSIAEKIPDAWLRDQFWMTAAQASTAKPEMLRHILKTIQSNSSRAEPNGSDGAEAAGIPPHWLAENSPLLGMLSNEAISGDNSWLSRTLAGMQATQIIQLLFLALTYDYVALARAVINSEYFSSELVNQQDASKATALMLASENGHHELIQLLLNARASVHLRDRQGRTALSRACEEGHVRAVKALISWGADINHCDGRGRTCKQLADQNPQLIIFLGKNKESAKIPNAERDRQLSESLHQLLRLAGFTRERAVLQQCLAELLDGVARGLSVNGCNITGSFAEGWANSLAQVNGKTAADSDIDWTFLVEEPVFHLEGGCKCNRSRMDSRPLNVVQGHALVDSGAGCQPAVSAPASGARPAQDACHAVQCCSVYFEERIRVLLPAPNQLLPNVHLVRATRPNEFNELRVSFSFHEKQIMRNLNTVQGQLFVIIKFIFKRYLPHTLATPGLKTYHAKTLLFFMLEKHGMHNASKWEFVNLICLLRESIGMMLDFINSRESSDECMPHFFMPDAAGLYFKNAGVGGDFQDTKARIRGRLCELRNDLSDVIGQIRTLLRPLQSRNFYFHPFCLLPLRQLRECTHAEIFDGCPSEAQNFTLLSGAYSTVHLCLAELMSDCGNRHAVMRKLDWLSQLECCRCASKCLAIMAHWKFDQFARAKEIAMQLTDHCIKRSWRPTEIERMRLLEKNYINWAGIPMNLDWAWRFCFACDTQPSLSYLPEFTQSLFTARLSQPRSSHLYVNFRCLSWSLQAELLNDLKEALVERWFKELQEDPDLEELCTLAHYSDCYEHLKFCLKELEIIRNERHIAIEAQDIKKIQEVREKLLRLEDQQELQGSTC